jgi:DNA replication protein DnaC
VRRAEALRDAREENDCEICGGAQFFLVKTDEKRAGFPVTCECVPLSIRAAMAGIPERYRGATFETFDAMDGKDEARASALRWDGRESVVMCGMWGVGKTHLACAMALSQLRKNRPVRFEDVKGFLDELKARFGTDQVQPYYERVADFPGVLVFDDLGAEQDGEWAEAQLRALLNRRYSRRLTTIVTTNLGHTAITHRIGGAVASRLSEWHWIMVEGVDVRPSLAAR